MPLDPQLQALRDQRERDGVAPLYTMTLAQARAADLASIQAGGGAPEPVAEVRDLTIPGPGGDLPLRLYLPALGGPLPVLFYFFGAAGCSAPSTRRTESPAAWPTGPARWSPSPATDPSRLLVGGDSAGGNLAAAVALRARDDGGPAFAGQLLVYPNTDQLADDQSMREADDPQLFNRHSVAWYRQHYLSDPGDAASPLASPLRAQTLAGLAPALVITAEYDPLRD
ncbi:MAG TPA: alpha/beta hydrolase [Streptosporangiaceae bacterium]|nr:alpha/beta hydrolase [Streptosporangiaceae bacterium]